MVEEGFSALPKYWLSFPASSRRWCRLRGRFVGVAVGGVPPPSFLPMLWVFVPGLPGGVPLSVVRGGLWVMSRFCRVVVHWWSLFPVLAVVPLVPAPPPAFVHTFFAVLLCLRPPGRWPASSPAGLFPSVCGVSFPPAHWCLLGRCEPASLAGRCMAGRCGLSVSYRWVPCATLMVSPGWGVACLGEMGAPLCGRVAVPPAFVSNPSLADLSSWGGEGRSAVYCS